MKILIVMGGFFPGQKYGGPPVSVNNFSQKVLVEIQRFKERYSDSTKPQITYKN